MRAVVLALVAWVAAPTMSLAQDRSVLFVHGIWSSRDAWEATALRLQNDLAISAQGHNTTDTAPYWNQADQLQNLTWTLPGNAIAIGHSNGGIVSRQLSRQRQLGGIITIGTPHHGTYLPQNGSEVASYHTQLLATAFGLGNWLAEYFGWAAPVEEVAFFIDRFLSDAVGLIASRLSTVHSPVLNNMGPSSSYRSNLNATVAQEASPKASFAVIANDYSNFGLALATYPDSRSFAVGLRGGVAYTLVVAAEYMRATYPPYSIQAVLADRIERTLTWGSIMDNMWCYGVTNDFYCNTPSDAVVPTWSMHYPSADAVRQGIIGPAHTQQTREARSPLYGLLTEVFGIPARGSGGGGGTPVVPSYCTHVGLMGPGQRLRPDESLCSPNGQLRLLYQLDGNVVLYGPGGVGWAANTAGTSLGSLEMQGDGNLVLYDSAGISRWDTGTWYLTGAVLELLDSGHLLLSLPSSSDPEWEVIYLP